MVDPAVTSGRRAPARAADERRIGAGAARARADAPTRARIGRAPGVRVWLVALALALLAAPVWARAATAPAAAKPAAPASAKPTAQPAGATTGAPADAATGAPAAAATGAPAAATAPAATSPAPTSPAAASGAAAPGAAPNPGGTSAAPGAGGSRTDERSTELYGDRIDGLQREVDDLKDRIFRTKARLALLKETVLRGVLGGARVILVHRNLMGSAFRLTKISYSLDGAQIFARSDEQGALDREAELVVFDGNLPPGPHVLAVELVYKGQGYGVFSYMSGLTFTTPADHTFTVPEAGGLEVLSVGYPKGNLTTEFRNKPAVRWEETPLDAAGRPVSSRAKGKPKAPAKREGEGVAGGG